MRINVSKSIIAIIIVWFIAIGSLLGTHFLIKKKPYKSKNLLEVNSFLESLDEELKLRVMRFESGIIKSAEGDLLLVGDGFEDAEKDLVSNKRLALRKLDFRIKDPILLERQIATGQAFKTLNNAEKKCVVDYHATIIYRNGSYFLAVDPQIYQEYVVKYGTECISCDEKTKQEK